MTFSQAIVLGLVQGLTEFLPVSSTAHLILAESFFKFQATGGLAFYNLFLQSGSILAIALFYRRRIGSILGSLFRRSPGQNFALNLGYALLPTAFFGLLLDGWLQRTCYSTRFIACTLFIGGLYLLFFEKLRRAKRWQLGDFNWRAGLFIGTMQSIALFPGVSRCLMTLTAGILSGLAIGDAIEFSFLLGGLTLFCATILKLTLSMPAALVGVDPCNLALGFLSAALFSLCTIGFFIGWLKKSPLKTLGAYRLLLALLLFWP